MQDVLLTTIDNPWNPFTHFDEWFVFDEQKGYHTCSYLDRICKNSEELSEEDQDLILEKAINEILSFNLTGKYTIIGPKEQAPKTKIITKI